MASKTIISREKTAEGLRGVLVSHGAEAADELAKALAPEASEEVEMPEMEDFQILLRRRLDTSRQRLVAADEAHLAVLKRLAHLRRSRDGAVEEVRRLLARLRHLVEGVYGPSTSAEVLLLEGPTPRDPVVLQRTATRVVEHLEELGFPRPEEALAGIELAPHLWIDLLRQPLERLGASLVALTHEKRSAVDSLLAKNAAKKNYDRLYGATTRMVREFFRYVGMDEMAATVRPRRRKASAGSSVLAIPDEIPETSAAAPSPALGPHLVLLPASSAPDPSPAPFVRA